MYETITLATISDLDAYENIDTKLSDESQADICRKDTSHSSALSHRGHNIAKAFILDMGV